MKNIAAFLILLFIPALSYAQDYSMRRCLLLPVTDSAGHSLGFEVYEKLEDYLKDAGWCEYVSSAELIGVFSKYRSGLKAHLEDDRVLRTIADKLQVGTLIRLNIEYDVNLAKLELDIVGENGKDLYFSEKAAMESPDADQVLQRVKSWLEIYETSIPYDGKILGILGDQVTFSYQKSSGIQVGQDFRVRRLINKAKHPLLKKVVEWETQVVAKGKVFNINNDQALGNIKVYEQNTKLKQGDWIVLEEFTADKAIQDVTYDEAESNQFGKLGFASLYFDIANSSLDTNTTDNNEATGITYGFSAELELWVTREYFITGELGRRLGNLKEKSGNLSSDNVSITHGVYKLGAGYKYLPLGFFYGPQINLSAGYANYTYDVEESGTDGFGQNSISGFYIGVGGNMPLQRGIRLFGEAEFIPFSSFTDEDNIFGSEKSSSSLMFKGGVRYQYTPLVSIDGAVEVQNNSAKFKSGNTSQVGYNDTIFKIGGSFIF